MPIRELDKAKRILDRQAKAGEFTISYYDEAYPHHFRNLCRDALPLVHVLGNKDLLNREDNVAIIGARAADKDGLTWHTGLLNRWVNKDISSSAVWLWDATRLPTRGVSDADGQTIALVASGLDITHPRVNKSLQDEIIAKGGAIPFRNILSA